MKNIIDIETKEIVHFGKNDFPMLIHGREHSGASLFSVTVMAQLHREGNKLLMFTAYPMAKEEFLSQIDNGEETVIYIEDETFISRAKEYQTIIVQSGNQELFVKTLLQIENATDRIIFVKNIETLTDDRIPSILIPFSYILSGDIDTGLFKDTQEVAYRTKVFFTQPKMETVTLPELLKYQAFLKRTEEQRILSVSQ